MQGVRILRNEAYFLYVGMTKDEAQRRRWAFYEAVLFGSKIPRNNFEQVPQPFCPSEHGLAIEKFDSS